MKQFTKGCAVDVRDMSEVMFEAIKMVSGVLNHEYCKFEDIKKDKESSDWDCITIDNEGDFVLGYREIPSDTLLTPIDILGEHLVKAIEEGANPWFEGDEIPVGYGYIYDSSGLKWDVPMSEAWSEDNRDISVIAYKPINQPSIESTILSAKVGAHDILQSALGHMQDRAKTYDNDQGERSVGKTVAMFNTLYGKDLTEEQGWAFMCLLKMVRSSQGEFKLDNYEDLAAYSGLMGESAALFAGGK